MNTEQRQEPAQERWVFLGSGLLLIVAVLIGLAREQRWGVPMVELHLRSADAGSLRPGQEVRISGLPVGYVKTLQLQSDASVAVRFQVARRYAQLIGPKSVATQAQEGFVGDHYLSISPDPQPISATLAIEGGTVQYKQPVAMSALMQQLVSTQEELYTTLRNTRNLTAIDIPLTLREARTSLNGVNQLAATLRRESVATSPELRQALRQLTRTSGSAEQTSSQAQELLKQSQPVLIRTLQDLQQLTSSTRHLLQTLLGSGEPSVQSKPQQP